MIKIEGSNASLAKVDSGPVARQERQLSIGELEFALLARFPKGDAEQWDRTGLIVGDPACPVTGVAVALDPTRAAIESAEASGANVLLTHHPVFLDPPTAFSPSIDVAPSAGVNVWTAARKNIALMNFHTALDVSVAATRILPGMLSLDFEGIVEPIDEAGKKGYGPLCSVRPEEGLFRLSHLASRCTSVFGRPPRVWGDYSKQVKSVVVANGSAGNVIDACVASGVDCLVCGEVRYHAALDAAQAGLCIVELGHDVSELPLVALLAQSVVDVGVAQDRVIIIDQNENWLHPDSTRI